MTHAPQLSRQMLTVLALTSGLFISAHAQTATELHTRATAAMCANCHGTDGRTTTGSAIPALVGMPKEYMVRQLAAFKDGSRPATVMHQISKGLTEAQVETLSSYYASLKR